MRKKVSKERAALEDDLLFYLRNYYLLRGIHHEKLDEYINYLVELLKNKQD